MKKFSKVELATTAKAKIDEVVANEAAENIASIETKVAKLTAKQIADIQERYCIDVINTLESLKIAIKNECNGKTALLYKALKRV